MEIIEIQGFIGQDAQSKETNGVEYTHFSVAVTKKFKKNDGTVKEKTNWYAVFKPISKLDNYLKKGVAVIVRGDLTAEIDKYEGKEKIAYSINNPKIYFSLGNRKHEEAETDQHTETTTTTNSENNQGLPANVNFDGIPPDDDLPF